MTQTELLRTARRLVVKVGSTSVTGENVGQIPALIDTLAAAHARGTEVVLVSSGAMATALPFMQLSERPSDLATQQATAAVGQNKLMWRYQTELDRHSMLAGQVLLTASDMEHETPRTNARRAMDRLLKMGILPIVNENDTVATYEIRFGDNDRLAALVAELIGADALVLLSDVDAIYTKPPKLPGAERVRIVRAEDDLAGIEIGESDSAVGTGGAGTKVASALYAAEHGTSTLITSTPLLSDALAGADVGTWFPAQADSSTSLNLGSDTATAISS